jgi:hypothetical protein
MAMSAENNPVKLASPTICLALLRLIDIRFESINILFRIVYTHRYDQIKEMVCQNSCLFWDQRKFASAYEAQFFIA